MLVVKVELWPGGDWQAAEELARLFIENDLTGTTESGNYNVRMVYGPENQESHAKVTGHWRLNQWPSLVQRSIGAACDAIRS